MGRERRLFRWILTMYLGTAAMTNCISDDLYRNIAENEKNLTIRLDCGSYEVKSHAEENAIMDVNLLVFHEGEIVENKWMNGLHASSSMEFQMILVSGKKYTFYALANYGSPLKVTSLKELNEYHIQLPETDILSKGMLMSGCIEGMEIGKQNEITIPLIRMLSKISIRIDRSRLTEDVNINVRRLKVGNSPKYLCTRGINRVETRFDRYKNGQILNESDCAGLNSTGKGGLSEEVTLFIPENMQGDFPYDISQDEDKVFDDDDESAEICSYIEVEMSYQSSDNYTTAKNLIYRFYLGESLKNLDVERNCHYHITITPEDDGLSGSGWRVDKTGIGAYVKQIILSEYKFKMDYKGQENLLEAEILPEDAYDRSIIWETSNNNVAEVSEDGLVRATGEGTCLISCTSADGSGCSSTCEVYVKYSPPEFTIYPGDFISGRVGESIHIWCDFFPPNAPFDPGYEELAYDQRRGIYSYQIDESGHGVTLTLKKPGTGIVYMSVGEPVNDSGMVIVEVLP